MKGHLQERVYKRFITDPESGCLLWTGGLDDAGYGRVWDSRTKKQTRIHRLMWELANGPIPDGLVVDHVKARGCCHRNCGNVEHLELVTRAENRHRDTRTHCRRGHEKTPENTYIYGSQRMCKMCRRVTRAPRTRAPARKDSWEILIAAVRRETARRRAAA